MQKQKPYVIDKVPERYKTPETQEDTWYCHMKSFPDIPVFGSIGNKRRAMEVCRMMNRNVGCVS